MAPPQGGGGGACVIQVVHMDDAAPELSDLVRRPFSIAVPWTRVRGGGVICVRGTSSFLSTLASRFLIPARSFAKKCGFFERTDSCSRPEQFPRGPLAFSTLCSRSPPQDQICSDPHRSPSLFFISSLPSFLDLACLPFFGIFRSSFWAEASISFLGIRGHIGAGYFPPTSYLLPFMPLAPRSQLMSHHPPPLPFRPSRSPTFFSPYFVSSTSVPFSQPLRRLHTLAHLHRASLCPARRHPGGAPAASEVGKGKGTAR
ncbi:hypothetical protein B0H13DRAFT_2032597 [Mycena leptocephala]|nr:hypothetical protein B0H13DRAFT_2032597 [Mycena leptocephala]